MRWPVVFRGTSEDSSIGWSTSKWRNFSPIIRATFRFEHLLNQSAAVRVGDSETLPERAIENMLERLYHPGRAV